MKLPWWPKNNNLVVYMHTNNQITYIIKTNNLLFFLKKKIFNEKMFRFVVHGEDKLFTSIISG